MSVGSGSGLPTASAALGLPRTPGRAASGAARRSGQESGDGHGAGVRVGVREADAESFGEAVERAARTQGAVVLVLG